MQIIRSLPVVICLSSILWATSETDANRLITEALKPSPIASNLRKLTDEVGGRVTGTPAMDNAVAWAVEAFKAAGADSVHTEEFTMQASWAEGATEMRIVDPVSFPLHVVSLAWAPALAPQKHVPVIDVGNGSPGEFEHAPNLAGAVLLVHQGEMKTWEDLDLEYEVATGIIDRALKAKAIAIAFQSTRPYGLMYRHTNTVAGEIDRIPMVLVSREDAGRVGRLLAAGKSVFADLAIPNQIGGQIKTANVIAEIRGSEKPQEFAVLGAHLDSWELGTGALDNGCNAALVIDALRTIKASGLTPKRSIRFVLFSGEEEGLYGSRMYMAQHKDELNNAVGMVNFDNGNGRATGFSLSGRKDILKPAAKVVAPLKKFGATQLTTNAGVDTDNFDFMLEGIPTFNANQVEANYLMNYHASSDTYDKVDIPQLKQLVADAVVVTFALANDPDRIGPRLTRKQIEETLKETKLDQVLKDSGMWDDWVNGKRGRTD